MSGILVENWAVTSLTLPAVAAVTYLATSRYLVWARNRDLLDHPGDRSSHEVATVTGGGAGIVIGVLAGWIIFVALGIEVAKLSLIGAIVLAVLGALDDRRSLPVLPRLVVQATVAAIVMGVLVAHEPFAITQLAWFCIAVPLLIVLTNFYNFMDGIDGLAALQAVLIAAAGIVLLPSSSASVTLLLLVAAACVGFLFLNWPPAQLFMGDTGSLFIGFLLAAAVVVTSYRAELALATWAILWAAFLGDAGLTLLLRIWRREKWRMSHRQHAYQRLSRRWDSHRSVIIAVLMFNIIWLWPLAALTQFAAIRSIAAVVLAYLPVIAVVCYLDKQTCRTETAKMPESNKKDTAPER